MLSKDWFDSEEILMCKSGLHSTIGLLDAPENQLGQTSCYDAQGSSSGSSQDTQAYNGIAACCDSTSSIDINNSLNKLEESLTGKVGGPGTSGICSEFSMDSDRQNKVPFSNHKALVDANSGTMKPTNFRYATRTMDQGSGRCSVPSEIINDPNKSPGTTLEAISSSYFSSQFAPITPDKSKRENRQVLDIVHVSLDESTQKINHQGNEVAIASVEIDELHQDKEQQQQLNDLSSGAVFKQLLENYNPDKGGNSGTDLNRAPEKKLRRKRHRPKVVIEGKPKRTPKPATPKPGGPKRKYVRRNTINKTTATPTSEEIHEINNPRPEVYRAKSSKRKLNFENENQTSEESSSCRAEFSLNIESQVQNHCSRVESTSTGQLEGIETMVEQKHMGIACNLTSAMDKVPEQCEADPPNERPNFCLENEPTRVQCQTVSSGETHDKQGNKTQMKMSADALSGPRSPDGYNCCSSTRTKQRRRLKQGISCVPDMAETSSINSIEVQCNTSHGHLTIFPVYSHDNQNPNIYFPLVCKKQRTENSKVDAIPCIQNDICAAQYALKTSWTISVPQFEIGIMKKQNTFMDAQQASEWKLPLDNKRKMAKKTCKDMTRLCNLASLIGIEKGKRHPTFHAGGEPPCSHVQGYEIFHHVHTSMGSPVAATPITMTTKKQKRRHHVANSTDNGHLPNTTWNKELTVGEVAEMLNSLDINLESIHVKHQDDDALVPCYLQYEEQKALVLYQSDGTIVPFGSLFELVRKRHSRPKVDLDEETNRVWKLLLKDINSEGIDGTDEEKARWWEEERRIFQGRADSFIARMNLVQGDRHFSPWKGSVLDSVIGVFLTQNVSDHLSSSAFMALAARFPLKWKTNSRSHFGETMTLVREPETFAPYAEGNIRGNEKKSYQPACNGSFSMAVNRDDIEKVANSHDLLESSTNCNHLYSPGLCTEMYNKHSGKRAMSLTGGSVARELDNRLCPQDSVVSSQHSLGSASSPAGRTKLWPQGSSEADQTTMSHPDSNIPPTSFLELLRRVGTMSHEVHDHRISSSCEKSKNSSEKTELEIEKQNMGESDACKASARPDIASSKTIPNSGTWEVGCCKRMEEESLFSDISNTTEHSASEQSEITEELVSPTMVQNFITESFQEGSKSSIVDDETCKSLHGGSDNIFQSQCIPVENINNMVQSQTKKLNTERIKPAVDVTTLSKEIFEVSERTSATNSSENRGQKAVGMKNEGYLPHKTAKKKNSSTLNTKRGRIGKDKQITFDWDSLRKQAQSKNNGRERSANTMDSLDWEAVLCADVDEIANTIRERGMNNRLAERIKDFLNRLVKEHGSIDLEWLRDIPPDKAKEYLLSIRGLGLKSVECVRLLTLHQLAFPVDTNVGRIAVRLGWVPLQPLPESLQLHLLELYPVLESIQRYLWPRLCKLDQKTLYELHYQMITFGKVFCTKSKPNCNACPMRGECRHFASAFASARLALPAPAEKSLVSATESKAADQRPTEVTNQMKLPLPEVNLHPYTESRIGTCELIVELPTTPEPIIEVPETPEPELQKPESDIEDAICDDSDEIPTIRLNIEEFTQNLQSYMLRDMELQEVDVSKALVALTPKAASIPVPKLKNVSQLRTEHQVYELPDSHPLLERLDKREPGDPCSYLLAIWTPGETADSIQPPERICSSKEVGKLCDGKTCFSCNSTREATSQTVRGTLLIPCRTAMRGSFPLNGTYFQVNEVFADHESSLNPIDVPRAWIWNLPRRMVFFGTSIPSIFKGLSTQKIQYCFWRGFVCVRGFDQRTRAPRPLIARLHFPASKLAKRKSKTDDTHK